MKLIITGGHPTPAFAFVEYLQKHHPDVVITFIGRTTTRTSDHQPSPEQMMAKQHQLTFFSINAPKFGIGFSIFNFWRMIQLLLSTVQALWLVNQIKPDVILCFGSYLAVPVAIAGYLSGVRVITHEQTRGLGRANQLIARFVQTLALSHPLSQTLSYKNTVVVGNLLRPSLFALQLKRSAWLPKINQLPLLYITGGEQGSEVINAAVAQIIPQLLKHFIVIHQCGPASQKRNYWQELNQVRNSLTQTMAQRYIIKEWISATDLGYIYQQPTLILARSGANTIDEITAFRLPSVLIPLPFSQGQEQLQNAKSLVEPGAALLLEQKDLTPELLLKQLISLKQRADQMRLAFPHEKDQNQASQKLWQLIELHVKT